MFLSYFPPIVLVLVYIQMFLHIHGEIILIFFFAASICFKVLAAVLETC